MGPEDPAATRGGEKEVAAVPTGVALRDARRQLFDAAERVLLRDGAYALTSRAVTTEAGCAKGVLHRHFVDFDDFLVELVRDRAVRIEAQAGELLQAAGTGTVVGNLSAALTEVFGSIVVSILSLTIARDEVRTRLRSDGSRGLPLVREIVRMVADYLRAERDLGRVLADADIASLAPNLVGAAHLRFVDYDPAPPRDEDVQHFVRTMLGGVLAR
jgi:AcrR family transcriptional regulator